MKRLLTVLSRRAIHEQCIKAKALLQQQQKREALETRRFELEQQLLTLQHKIENLQGSGSLAELGWRSTLAQLRIEHEKLMIQLHPIRKGEKASLSLPAALPRHSARQSATHL